MRILWTRALVLVTILSIVPTSVRGQQQSGDSESDVQLRTTEVLLDIVASDDRGRPVLDLKQEEIEVSEDGEKQAVTSFGLVRVGAGTTGQAAAVGKVPVPIAESPFRDYNLILVVVDRTSVHQLNLGYVYKAAEKFVNERLGPNDLVAVFACASSLVMLQNFTNDKPRLLEALKRATQTAGGTTETPQAADIAASQATILATGVEPIGGKASTDTPISSAADLARRLNDIANGIDTTLAGLRDQVQATALIHDLLALTKVYAHVRGRKSVLLYSEGFSVNSTVEGAFATMIGGSNRNNFAFYTIDAAGLRVNVAAANPSGPASAIRNTSGDRTLVDIEGNSGLGRVEKAIRSNDNSALNRLATETGGVALRNSNDMNRGFQAVENDLRSYYALSYTPTDADLDGSYRTISVKVSRKGVELRTRAGYYAVPGGSDSLLLPYEQPVLEMIGSATTAARPADLNVAVRTERFRSGTGWIVPVTIGVDGAALAPIPSASSGDTATYEVDAVALVRNGDKTVVEKMSCPTYFRVPSAEREGFAKTTAMLSPFPRPLELAPGIYTMTIGVMDPTSKKGTVVERTFKLPEMPPAGAPALSSLVLSRATEAVPEADAGRLASDPLVFGGKVRVVPNVTGQFVKSRGDQLVAFFRVYGAPNKQYQVRLQFTKSNALVSQTQPALLPATDAHGETAFASALPLDSFEPGAYLVQLSILEPGASTPVVSATATFRIDP